MSFAACIIEPRPEHLKISLENHLPFLPESTIIYIFTDTAKMFDVGNFTFLKWNIYNLNDLSHREHGEMMASRKFWNTFKEDHILTFQSDSQLLREGIEAFIGYDFIGAPIKNFPHPCMNGGLSIRSKAAMLKVLDNYSFNYSKENEDIFFCKSLEKLNGNLPSAGIASKFSCETIFKTGTLGYHAIEKYLTPEQCNQLKNQYSNGIDSKTTV
jgi:hypothetical protein